MLGYLTLIFCCQLLGELLATGLNLPLPGPVCGMVLLLCGLHLHGSVPAALERTTDVLLGNLSLLFIPAGAGVMLHAGLMQRDWVAITIALTGSTVITIAVTASVMAGLSRYLNEAATARRDGPS